MHSTSRLTSGGAAQAHRARTSAYALLQRQARFDDVDTQLEHDAASRELAEELNRLLAARKEREETAAASSAASDQQREAAAAEGVVLVATEARAEAELQVRSPARHRPQLSKPGVENSNTAVADVTEVEQDEDAKLVESGDPELIALERELQKQMQQFCPQLMVARHQDEQEPPRSRPGDTTPNSSDGRLRSSLSASSSSLSNLVGAGGASASFAGSASQLSTPNTIKKKMSARGVSSVSKRDRDREANGLRRENQGDAKIADLLRETDEQFFRLPRAAGAAGNKLVDVDTQVDELAGLKLEMQMLENALGEAQSADEVADMSGAALHEHDNYDKEGTGSLEEEIEKQKPLLLQPTTTSQSYVVDAVTQLALEELGALEKEWTALKKKEQAMCAVEELQHEKVKETSSSRPTAEVVGNLRRQNELLRKRLNLKSTRKEEKVEVDATDVGASGGGIFGGGGTSGMSSYRSRTVEDKVAEELFALFGEQTFEQDEFRGNTL